MSRIARAVTEGVPHHVTQRGNGAQTVFRHGADFLLYLDLLHVNCRQYRVALWAYCLMPNHVHLVAVPERPLSLAKTLGRTHADYARHLNIGRGSFGHVWQARFFSCALEGAHLVNAVAYVERNPVRAGPVSQAAEYRWSSATARIAGRDTHGLIDLRSWPVEYTGERWSAVLATSVAEEAIADRLREATVRGRPVGSAQFITELEKRSGRRLRPQPVGRPRKDLEPQLLQEKFDFGNGV